jgi:hypothetical protein
MVGWLGGWVVGWLGGYESTRHVMIYHVKIRLSFENDNNQERITK